MLRALTIIVALILGVCIVGSVQTSASAQESQAYKVAQFKRWLDGTDPAKFYGQSSETPQARSERLRRIWSRSLRPAGGGALKSTLIRGGLAGVAAGVWIHNGVTLYHVADCGDTSCPDPLSINAEFRQAQEDVEGTSAAGAVVQRYSNGQLVGAGMVTGASVSWVGRDVTVNIEFTGESSISSSYIGSGGHTFEGSPASSINLYTGSGGETTVPAATSPTSPYRFYTRDVEDNVPQDVVEFGPTWSYGESVTWQNPVFDTGLMVESPPEYTPTEGDYLASPAESDALYERFVSDPEYNPDTDTQRSPREEHDRKAGALIPEHGEKVWTTENPDGSFTTRFQDGTEFTTWPDGTEMLRRADGTQEWRYPDGTTRTIRPDGTEITRWPDGTTRTRTSEGTEEWTDPNGAPRPAPGPNEYPEPPTQASPGSPGGPTSQGDSTCAVARTSKLDLPELDVQDKFPFSLILWTVQSLEVLSSPPAAAAPCLNLPFGDNVTWCFSEMQGTVNLMRNLAWFFGAIFLMIGFYILIKGGSKTE